MTSNAESAATEVAAEPASESFLKKAKSRLTATQADLDRTKGFKKGGMFPDRDDMKKKLTNNLRVEKYDVMNYYKTEGTMQAIAKDKKFEYVTLGVISFNALWISIDTQYNNETVLNDAHPIFIIMENLFCFYFVFEWVVRFGAFEKKHNGFKDAWFVFDTFMVVMMVLETWIMFVIMAITGFNANQLGNAGTIRLLRLLRLSRMARMAKLLRSMPELLILIKGIGVAVQSVFYTLVLIIILTYVFAIYFRMMTLPGSDMQEDHFKKTTMAMHTLLMYGTFLDSLGTISFGFAENAKEESGDYINLIVWYLFVLFSSLMLLNMLIGILCEVIAAVGEEEREGIDVDFLNDNFKLILHGAEAKEKGVRINEVMKDAEKQEFLSSESFTTLLQIDDMTELLNDVGVDVFGLTDLMDVIFTDECGDEKEIEVPELIEVLLDHREKNTAKLQDITTMRKYVTAKMTAWKKQLHDYSDLDKDGGSTLDAQLQTLGNMLEASLEASQIKSVLPQGSFNAEVVAVEKEEEIRKRQAAKTKENFKSQARLLGKIVRAGKLAGSSQATGGASSVPPAKIFGIAKPTAKSAEDVNRKAKAPAESSALADPTAEAEDGLRNLNNADNALTEREEAEGEGPDVVGMDSTSPKGVKKKKVTKKKVGRSTTQSIAPGEAPLEAEPDALPEVLEVPEVPEVSEVLAVPETMQEETQEEVQEEAAQEQVQEEMTHQDTILSDVSEPSPPPE